MARCCSFKKKWDVTVFSHPAHSFAGVVGVEPSCAPIAAAREDVRPLLREGIFRVEDFVPESLSLVTCFQTLKV